MTGIREKTQRIRDQRWLADMAIGARGLSSQHSYALAMKAGGHDIAMEMMSVSARVKKYVDISREFAKVAAKRVSMAEKAENEGYVLTARDHYFVATVFYASAQFPINFEDDNKENIEYNVQKNACYDKFIKYAPRPIARVEMPFEGKSLPRILHLPEGSFQRVPCVL